MKKNILFRKPNPPSTGINCRKSTVFSCFTGIILWMGVTQLQAQESVNSGGGDVVDSKIVISYSLGQVFFEPASSSENAVTPGIQQAYEISLTTGLPDVANLTIQVYPNPATEYLNLSFPGFNEKKYTLTLTDPTGRNIYIDEIKNKISKIEVQDLAAGVYFLQIADKKQLIKVFKIIKK